MNVVFLDIDGVLNSARSQIAFHHLIIADTHMDETWHLRHTKLGIDPVAVGLFNKILRDFDARIVLSSSKRMDVNPGPNKLEELRSYLLELGVLGDRLIGWTPVLDTGRGNEIKLWMERNPGVTQYVIIDDYDDEILSEQRHRLIHTNSSIGYSEFDYRATTKLFGREDTGMVFI